MSKLPQIQREIDEAKALVKKLERKYIDTKNAEFRAKAKLPIWEDRPRGARDWKIDRSKAYETKTKWMPLGYVGLWDQKEVFGWCCIYCKRDHQTKYIATGHDHTDYSYEICDCEGARKGGGKHYDDLD